MKFVNAVKKVNLVIAASLFLSVISFAQSEPTPTPTPANRERVSKTENPESKPLETATPTVTPEVKSTPEDGQTITATTTPAEQKDLPPIAPQDTEDKEIKEAILPFYNNYLTEYRLGPEDVISVEVFSQPNYSKAGITIPPTATISYPLIPGGIFVAGKTTDQIAKEIAKKLDEYIIDPQVTVTLEKVGSAQFSILGKVGAPGVRTMTRRYSVYDAIVEAGGLAPDADKKRITLLRRTASGSYTSTFLKIDEMVSGKVPMEFLNPGDQIVVPEKKWSLTKILQYVGMASSFRILSPL